MMNHINSNQNNEQGQKQMPSMNSSFYDSNNPRTQSPHKMTRMNKMRRYEEIKSPNKQQEEEDRNFSPLNKNKTFGLRMGGPNNDL